MRYIAPLALLAFALSLGACAANDSPRAAVPASFVGHKLADMQAAYGEPSEFTPRTDGTAVASFLVADARTAPHMPAISAPRMVQPVISTGRRPQTVSRGEAAVATGPTRSRLCTIDAAVNTDGVVTSVAASAEVCNHITRPG